MLYSIKSLSDDFEDVLKDLYERAMETGTKMTKDNKKTPWTHEQKVFLERYVAAHTGKDRVIAWAPMKDHFEGFYDYHTEMAMVGFASKKGWRFTSGHT